MTYLLNNAFPLKALILHMYLSFSQHSEIEKMQNILFLKFHVKHIFTLKGQNFYVAWTFCCFAKITMISGILYDNSPSTKDNSQKMFSMLWWGHMCESRRAQKKVLGQTKVLRTFEMYPKEWVWAFQLGWPDTIQTHSLICLTQTIFSIFFIKMSQILYGTYTKSISCSFEI